MAQFTTEIYGFTDPTESPVGGYVNVYGVNENDQKVKIGTVLASAVTPDISQLVKIGEFITYDNRIYGFTGDNKKILLGGYTNA